MNHLDQARITPLPCLTISIGETTIRFLNIWPLRTKNRATLVAFRDRDPERISCASVTRNFFSVIGVSPEIGRIFSEDEDKIGASPRRCDQRSPLAAGVQPQPGRSWSLDNSARSELNRYRRDAAADDFAARHGRVVFIHATQQQPSVDGSFPSPDDLRLGQTRQPRCDC